MSDSSWHAKALAFKGSDTSAVIPENEDVLMLIEGTNPFGDRIFCYLKLTYEVYQLLRDMMLSGDRFNPRDFGEIVAAGQGHPTDELKEEIREEYGFVPVSVNDAPPDQYAFEDVDDYPF